jgi:uncharacterized protein YndB with AHSA1/START domain
VTNGADPVVWSRPSDDDRPESPGDLTGHRTSWSEAGIANVSAMSIVEVTERIDASPERIWEVIGNPVAMSDLTAECTAMTWVGEADGPALGARFRGKNRSGWRRWTTTCTLVRYQPNSEIAWDVAFGSLPVATWGYRIEEDGEGGATVSERFEDRRGSALRAVGPLVRGTRDPDGRNRANMTTTLARIKARAEG